jgi:BirA family biotin operon repressor/biotin-[acetyl-CoA-carboxylase] ligase
VILQAWPVLRFDQLDSTNAEACRRAEAGEGGPLWITARDQTAGRGRRGRAWSGHPGNLATTLLITTDRRPAEAAMISFVAALAAHDVMQGYAAPGLVTLKWPNDVLIAGEKAAGLLIESGATDAGGLWLAVGMGLNLAWSPDDAERPATTLVDHLAGNQARAPTPDEALAALDQAMQWRLEQWQQDGPRFILADWSARASGIPGPCTARLGHETVTGWAEGLADDGALRLRLDTGEVRLISAGDVFFGADV